MARDDVDQSPILDIAWFFWRLVRWATVQWYLHWWLPDLRDRVDIPDSETIDAIVIRRRGQAIDFYVLSWIAAELMMLIISVILATPWCFAITQLLAISRILDIVRAGFGTSLLDQAKGRADNRVASPARIVLLSMVNYLELMACFGIIYSAHRSLLDGKAVASGPEPLYFSVLTQLTISFGDPLPLAELRYVAASQGLLGLLFIALVISRMVSSLKPLVRAEVSSPPSGTIPPAV